MGRSTAEKPKRRLVNGVDVSQLFGTIEAIKDTPEIAKFKFRAHNKWVNGGHNHTTIKDFHGAQENHPHLEPFELDLGFCCVGKQMSKMAIILMS